MQLLVTKSDNIDVTIYCWEVDGTVEASHDKNEVPREDGKEVEKVKFTFRKPGYADSNIIIRNADFKVGDEGNTVNFLSFQESVLRALWIDWDRKDDNGDKIPVNSVTINNLIPSVARAAVSGVLDKIRI